MDAQLITVPSLLFLSFLCGVLLVASGLYVGVYVFTRTPVYLSVALLGLTGLFFVGSEAAVITCGLLNDPHTGMQFHRLEALSAAFFLFALPYYLGHLLELGPGFKKANRVITAAGAVAFIILAVAAFAVPEWFIGFTSHLSATGMPWREGRGTPGILYRLRDLLITLVALYGAAMMAADLKLNRRFSYVLFSLIGTLFAILSGIIDFAIAARELPNGLFSIRVFSMFSLGVMLFVLLSMIGIMKWFIDQTKMIERMNKIEALGIMAGGIAHDFNNLLAGILGNASLMKEGTGIDEAKKPLLDEIEKAAVRAKNLSHQLLTFAQGGAPIRNTASIDQLVFETVDFIMRGSNITVHYHVAPGLGAISADMNQISQVVQNIMINAKQAMPDGGIVDITLDNCAVTLDTPHLAAGEYVRLKVRDYGTGMDPEVLASVFDPYFTTKDNGSGLGLAISLSIVKQHGGWIDAASWPKKGSEFTVMLPRAAMPADASPAEPVSDGLLAGRVLVMDDEEIIRTLCGNMLAAMGIECDTVRSGEEAVDAYSAAAGRGKPYDAVIMDLTVRGGMGGREALGKILAVDPSVKAVVSSGYSDSSEMADYRRYGFAAVIPKPYTFSELKKVMTLVLAGEQDREGAEIKKNG
ncbi:MAG TPA: ATP-binding protein [Spirochaetota bacterium]|nr:ATP-binding protein [Spirochaetota bacterium]HQF10272.1 ATP-binding protein [Spirochaetota bacterium]HQH99150.1 ATP-binding protein [Spirochaetota bacterium]HQJ72579.1 ATP-binding protein [Spirochaetota bacterium]